MNQWKQVLTVLLQSTVDSEALQRGIESLSDEWFAARRGRLTASKALAATGCCPWTSRPKLVQILRGVTQSFTAIQEERMARGREMEPHVRAVLNDLVRARLDYEAHVEDERGLYVCRANPNLAATPDGFVCSDGVLAGHEMPVELKTTGSALGQTPNDIPLSYAVQLAVQCHCTGAAGGLLFLCNPDMGYAVWLLRYRPKMLVWVRSVLAPCAAECIEWARAGADAHVPRMAPLTKKARLERLAEVIDQSFTLIEFSAEPVFRTVFVLDHGEQVIREPLPPAPADDAVSLSDDAAADDDEDDGGGIVAVARDAPPSSFTIGE